MARIRPATPLTLPGVRFSGSASLNNQPVAVQGTGILPLPRLRVTGDAVVQVVAGNVTAAGTIQIAKLKVGSGTAVARRRSRSQIAAVPLRPVVIAGTITRRIAASAVVQIYNAVGNPIGYGPAEDPDGVFFGRTDLANGDVWWESNEPANCNITPMAGGRFTIDVGPTVPPGVKSFTVNLRKANGTRTTSVKQFTVS